MTVAQAMMEKTFESTQELYQYLMNPNNYKPVQSKQHKMWVACPDVGTSMLKMRWLYNGVSGPDSGVATTVEKCFVLQGPWKDRLPTRISLKELMAQYTFEDGKPITVKALDEMRSHCFGGRIDWFAVVSKPVPQQFALFIPVSAARYKAAVNTVDKGQVVLCWDCQPSNQGNRDGDFVICGNYHGRPDFRQIRVVNSKEFPYLYNNRGWSECIDAASVIKGTIPQPRGAVAQEGNPKGLLQLLLGKVVTEKQIDQVAAQIEAMPEQGRLRITGDLFKLCMQYVVCGRSTEQIQTIMKLWKDSRTEIYKSILTQTQTQIHQGFIRSIEKGLKQGAFKLELLGSETVALTFYIYEGETIESSRYAFMVVDLITGEYARTRGQSWYVPLTYNTERARVWCCDTVGLKAIGCGDVRCFAPSEIHWCGVFSRGHMDSNSEKFDFKKAYQDAQKALTQDWRGIQMHELLSILGGLTIDTMLGK